jgi:hypothetical protein
VVFAKEDDDSHQWGKQAVMLTSANATGLEQFVTIPLCKLIFLTATAHRGCPLLIILQKDVADSPSSVISVILTEHSFNTCYVH